MRRIPLIVLFLLCASAPVDAEQLHLVFDADRTEISFTLDATLHTVHGSFRLESGSIIYDPATGATTGEIVVDARSGDSGNQKRDRDMHRKVLESESFPTIVFVPDRIDGSIPAAGTSTATVVGTIRLHGEEHHLEVPIAVEMNGTHVHITAELEVPYVKWGLKNPSKLLLRVAKFVTITVDGHATMVAGVD